MEQKEVVYKELSYKITGLLFKTHKELGIYKNEKQYADYFENLLKKEGINYKREYKKEDYYQAKRYLTTLNKKLAIIVNFRQYRLAPKRVLNSNIKI